MKLRLITIVMLMFILTACDLYEPIHIGASTLQYGEQTFPADTQPICNALENAGYIMPYGSPFGWYQFNIKQEAYGIESPNGSFVGIPISDPYLSVLVDWSIPADFNNFPDGVSQQTVDSLAVEAKNICHIVQSEAQKQGITNLKVHVSLRDLIVGTQIEYGEGADQTATSDCDQIQGAYMAKSVGLNPQSRTPNMCPSLYVPG